MHSKLLALSLLTTALATGCNAAAQDGDGMDGNGDGIDLGEDEGMDGSDSDSDSGDSHGAGGDSGDDSDDGSDSAGGSPNCGGERILLSSARPNVMLLLDKSGSMVDNAWDHDGDPDSQAVNRWTSLHDVTASMLSAYGETVNFGAVMFPALDSHVPDNADYDTTFDAACDMADDADVAVAEGTREAILTAMPARDAQFSGATPTREAVLTGLNHLETAPASGPRAMVLVTDGAANCVYDPNTRIGGVYDTELEMTVRSAYEDNGVPTYVVGIDIGAEHPVDGRNLRDDISAVALAGGVPRSGAEAFYNVADEDTLAAALDEIARRVECTVELESAPQDPGSLEVEIDGELQPNLDSCEGGDGWRYAADDQTRIELCNAACVSFRDVQQLDTTHACDPVG